MEQQPLLTELLWLKDQLDNLYIHPSTPSSGMAVIAIRRRLDALVQSVQSCIRENALAVGYTDNAEIEPKRQTMPNTQQQPGTDRVSEGRKLAIYERCFSPQVRCTLQEAYAFIEEHAPDRFETGELQEFERKILNHFGTYPE